MGSKVTRNVPAFGVSVRGTACAGIVAGGDTKRIANRSGKGPPPPSAALVFVVRESRESSSNTPS